MKHYKKKREPLKAPKTLFKKRMCKYEWLIFNIIVLCIGIYTFVMNEFVISGMLFGGQLTYIVPKAFNALEKSSKRK